ncbi:MAG: TolB family protein, partial [Gaiellaceae bacterium]
GRSSADEDPQWGPNGLIAFDTLRNGYNWTTSGPAGFKNNWDVYLMEIDGSNQQNLTECDLTPIASYWSKPGSGPAGNVCSNDQEPAFGAIGANNIMCLQSDAQTGTTSLHGIPFTLDSGGNAVMGTPYILVSSSGKDRECDWSADGTKLTYMSDRDGDWEIFVKDITTGVETQLTNNTVSDQHPGWTPDDRIVWNSPRTSGAVNINNADANEEMFIMDDDGSDVYQISFTNDGSYNSFPDVRTRFDLYDYAG